MLHKSLVRRLDLITLQLFVAVFEKGTLTRAAARNGVVQGVLDGVADLGICSSDTDTKGLPGVIYRRDKLVVLMPADHALAA